jgi:hypothetical protein
MAAKKNPQASEVAPELTGDGSGQVLPPFDGEALREAPAIDQEPRQASLADCNRQLLKSWRTEA